MSKAHDYIKKAEQQKDLNTFLFMPEPGAVRMCDDGELKNYALAIKDNIQIKDWPTTASSKILDGFIAPYDATVIKKLKTAGAMLIGKTNLDEFAMGSSTENSAFGVTKNPWDKERVPGGSSGGSASAVAADLCDAALGSDTGGSIRQPAAFCGVTGLKPTYGSVSRYGLLALASSLDVIGPLTRSAEDVEKIFQVISGKDELDQTTIDYNYQPTEIDWSNFTIGLPKELWQIELDPEIKAQTEALVEFYKQKGVKVIEVSLPSSDLALPAYYIILPSEVSANLARYDGIRYQKSAEAKNLLEKYLHTRANFGPEVKRRILLGTYSLSVGHYDDYYMIAERVRTQIKKEYAEVFGQVDMLITATTPTPAFKIGEKASDPIEMYKSDLLTVAANLAGVPALSLPVGFTKAGLPIGAQLISARKNDNIIIAAAKAFQKETDFHQQTPKIK
ncbi:Asp-tRNA(Asn)/Glu-tRNA(Gln) amidotransferase subunit GatA [Candidatus Berkelbacteria bacterium]|nr:Asp-tRNA(Asn)/Glu-tRNA(Gln) amidotransferase subunit GatA [Candidatus Berkelbacteria bacterium]